MELSEARLQRLLGHNETDQMRKEEDDPSFCLFSPRMDLDTPRVTDPLFSLIQQLEKTDEKSKAKLWTLRESLTQNGLKPGFSSRRSHKENSLIHTFADFEEINLSHFDFMENEIELPDTITQSMNLEPVDTTVLQARAEELHSKVLSNVQTAMSLNLLQELETREQLLQGREALQREITYWLEV